MIEAYCKPGSKTVLKNPVEYYKECESCSSESYINKNKACGACKLLIKGLGTVEKRKKTKMETIQSEIWKETLVR
jgi:hypothetical protein